MDNEIDRKIDVTVILFLFVQNRHQTHDWTLIGSGADGLEIKEWYNEFGSTTGMFLARFKSSPLIGSLTFKSVSRQIWVPKLVWYLQLIIIFWKFKEKTFFILNGQPYFDCFFFNNYSLSRQNDKVSFFLKKGFLIYPSFFRHFFKNCVFGPCEVLEVTDFISIVSFFYNLFFNFNYLLFD